VISAGWLTYADENGFLHFHDFFHYQMSAEFFPELGYGQIYRCTAQGLEELAESDHNTPRPAVIRDLSSRYRYIASDYASCDTDFLDVRWQRFKNRLQSHISLDNDPTSWQKLVVDQGNNPPPSWAVIPHLITLVLPDDFDGLKALPWLDVLLMSAAISLLLFKPNGIYWASLLVVLLMANWLNALSWTYGSFMRQMWLAALCSGLLLLRSRNDFLAGLLLGLSVMFRAFPAFIVLMIVASFLIRDRDRLPHLIAGGAVALISSLLLSATLFGLEYWIDFYNNIQNHRAVPYVNHLGYNQLVSYFQLYLYVGTDMPPIITPDLAALMKAQIDRLAWLHGLLKGLVVAAVSWLMISRIRSQQISLMLFSGMTLIFFFTDIAHYYYAMISLLAWFAIVEKERGLTLMSFIYLFFTGALALFDIDNIIRFMLINSLTMIFLLAAMILLFIRAPLSDGVRDTPEIDAKSG